jgi:hypothetical protein
LLEGSSTRGCEHKCEIDVWVMYIIWIYENIIMKFIKFIKAEEREDANE